MHAALVARPGSCVRRLGGDRAGEMQFRRLLHNQSVTAAEMSLHAGELTGDQISIHHRSVVEHPFGHDTEGEVERVVPAIASDLAL